MSGIESWSTTPANNNQSPPFGWPAGILPSQVEPIGRQMMTSLAAWYQAAEWINYNFTPTYVSATQFTLPGNVTPTFHVGRRVQATDGATSVYGTITVSAFTTLTTVTVVWDTGVLQTGVTIVYVGITSSINTSAPGAGSVNVTSATVPANGIYLPSANTLGFSSNTNARGSVNSTGNWNLVAPSSGTGLVVNGLAGGITAQFTDGVSDFRFSHSGGNSTLATSTNTSLSLGTAGNPKLTIANTGGVSIAAPTAGNALSLTGLANSFAALFAGGATTSQSFGLSVRAGTNSSDVSFEADNSGGSAAYFQVRGDGVLSGRGPTAAALVDMTPDKGTFTGTLTGMTAGTTGTVTWVRMGNIVLVYIAAAISGTSNLNAMTMTGLPAAIQPANTQIGQCPVTDGANGTIVGTFSITGGTITFGRATLNVSVIMYAQAFQNSGAKGLPAGWQICYSLA